MTRVHFMAIAGAGASAVAAIAKAEGFEVTGCDMQLENEFTKDLRIKILGGHSALHLKGVGTKIDILAVSPAVLKFDPENEEILEAKKLGVEVITWQEFMGNYLEEGKFVIAVSGTHGKSTTTAMVAKVLEDAGMDPTVEIGAVVPEWGRNYRISNNTNFKFPISNNKKQYFITEADEYNDNFLVTHPDIAVVTNIEEDHLDYFKDFQGVKDSFEKFLLQTKGSIVANISDTGVGEVIKWVMKESKLEVLDYSKSDFNLSLKIPGKHNLLNAQAAFQVGLLLGIEPEKIRQSLNSFTGIGRRLELIGEVNGAKVYSDFGHHPTEIKVTVDALTEKFSLTPQGWNAEKHLWVIFQPHLFSRTKTLFKEFVEVFKNLPVAGVMIAPIYPSREKDPGDITSKMLVDKIDKKNVEYTEIPLKYLEMAKYLGQDDVVVFMGAGDTDKWAREFISKVGRSVKSV